jgi:hypothetical protein
MQPASHCVVNNSTHVFDKWLLGHFVALTLEQIQSQITRLTESLCKSAIS